MVKIPDYNPSQRLDVGSPPQLPYRHLEIPAIGAGAARGEAYAARQLEGFGGAVEHLGADVTAYYDRKAAEADQAWLSKARAQTLLDAPQQAAQLAAGSMAQPAMGVGGAGVVPASPPKPLQQRTKAAWDGYSAKLLAEAPSERAKRAYTDWFATFGAEQQAKAFEFDQHRQEAQKNADFITALDTHTRLVSTDPGAFDAAWSAVTQDLQSAASWMPADKLAALRSNTRASMELARAKALMMNDPLQFQREVTPDPGNAGPENPRKPYGGWADNPYYSHLQPDQMAALSKDAGSAVVQQHNAAIAQQKAIYDNRYNDLMTTLLPGGKGGMTDVIEARRQGWLSDYTDIKKAVDAIDARDKDSQNLATATARVMTGAPLNPFIDKDRKDLDAVYQSAGGPDALLGAATGAGLSAHGQGVADPQAMAQVRLFAFAAKGIVPQSAVDEIRRGMVSQNQQEMTAAYTVLDGLSRAKETAAATKLAFNEADWKKLEQYQQLAPITKPEELVQEMNPAVDPATARKRDELRITGKKLLDGEVAKGTDYMADILSHFNGPNHFDYPTTSPDGLTVQALRDDYEAAFQRLYSYSGDETLAKAGALKALDNHWGMTEVGSGVIVMQNPPERSFLPIGDSRDWMDQQIEGVAKQAFPDATEWVPISLPETEGAAGVRQTPKWAVGVKDKDGVWQVLSPPPEALPGWPFDYRAAHAQAVKDFNDVRGSLLAPPPGSLVTPPKGFVFPFQPQPDAGP